MVHSGNIHKFFCEHDSPDSPDYPLKETNELIDEVNRIITEIKAQKYVYEQRNKI